MKSRFIDYPWYLPDFYRAITPWFITLILVPSQRCNLRMLNSSGAKYISKTGTQMNKNNPSISKRMTIEGNRDGAACFALARYFSMARISKAIRLVPVRKKETWEVENARSLNEGMLIKRWSSICGWHRRERNQGIDLPSSSKSDGYVEGMLPAWFASTTYHCIGSTRTPYLLVLKLKKKKWTAWTCIRLMPRLRNSTKSIFHFEKGSHFKRFSKHKRSPPRSSKK